MGPAPAARPRRAGWRGGSGRRANAGGRWTALLLGRGVLFLGAWEFATRVLEIIPVAFLPAPTAIARAFGELVLRADFWSAFGSIGVALAIVVGLAVGIVVGWVPVLQFTVAPFLWLLYSTPKIALAPLFIFILGLGNSSKIALTFLLAVFPILLNTMEGVQTANQSLVRAGRVYGFRGLAMGSRIVFPATCRSASRASSAAQRWGSPVWCSGSSSAVPAGWGTCSSAPHSTSRWTRPWRSSW